MSDCRPDSTGANWFECSRGTVGCPYVHDGRTPHCVDCAAGVPCRFDHDPPELEASVDEYRRRQNLRPYRP